MPSSGFVAAMVLLLISIGGTIAGVKLHKYDDLGPLPVALVGICIFLIGLVVGCLFPWAPSYHTMERHSGEIVRVEQRYVTDGSSATNITKEMAFWLSGEKEAYQTDDIRFQGLKAGDFVEIRRQKHWVYGGQNYWNATLLDAGK